MSGKQEDLIGNNFRWKRYPMYKDKYVSWICNLLEGEKGTNVYYNLLAYLINVYPKKKYYSNSSRICADAKISSIMKDHDVLLEFMDIHELAKLDKINIILDLSDYESIDKSRDIISEVNDKIKPNCSADWPLHLYLQKIFEQKSHIILCNAYQPPICMSNSDILFFTDTCHADTMAILSHRFNCNGIKLSSDDQILVIETHGSKSQFNLLKIDKFV